MIQRIQTVYLILVALASGLLTNFLSLWQQAENNIKVFNLFNSDSTLLKFIPILFIVSLLLALIGVFLFKNRKMQFVINRLNILTNLFLLGVLLYYLLNLPGESISEKGIGVFLPILNVLMLVLANRAIQKDENLVKSVDRLR